MTYIPTAAPGPVTLTRLTPLDANHIHAWEMNETSGSSFLDSGSSATKVNMTINNTSNIILGYPGLLGPCMMTGFTFTGTNASTFASCLVSSFTDLPTGNMTFEAWYLQPQVSGNNAALVVSCDFSNAINFQFGVNSTANDNYYITFRTANNFGNGSTGTNVNLSSARAVGKWTYLAVVYNGSNFLYYVDGVLANSQNATGAIQWANTNGPAPAIYIAGAGNSSSYVGAVSCVRLSNTNRSASYLRSVYQTAMAY